MDTTMTTQSDQPTRRRLGGRPKLLPEERKTVRMQVGFTQHQAELLADRADAAGLTDTELIRRLALQQPLNTIPAANREAIIELNRIGNNINQIAKGLNASALKPLDSEEAAKWLKKTQATIEAIGRRLTAGGAENGD